MKNIYIGLITLLLSVNAMAYHDKAWNTVQNNNRAINAGGCTRATSSTTIEFNNVRALIHTGGDMWWDLVGTAKYEVPKGSGKTALFAGAIWMGGTDVNDQLRLAAIKFRSGGVDYWPGPLIVSGMDRATITPSVCEEYDKHFAISRQEVAEFRNYINAVLAGDSETLTDNFAGYKIPDIIIDWPGNGDAIAGYDFYLAPYVDNDNSGDYNPESGGDYPFFDLDGSEPCGTSRELRKPRLFGDQTMWWVYNDKGNVHEETNGESIGMEIRAQYFAFATADELNNMTFGNYALINRSTYTLFNTYFGVWTDADLGYAFDDYVGCDVTRGLGYLYNGNDVDGSGSDNEYGEQPPAIGVDFFEGPYMDPYVDNGDTLDRPSTYLFDLNGNQTTQIDESMPRDNSDIGLYNGGINGLNFGDGIGGNERWGMRRFLYFNNDQTMRGDPEKAQQYYNYLDGLWKDNRSLTFGGTGYIPTMGAGTPAHFMFPGTTDPYDWGTEGVDNGYTLDGGWTEENENNPAADRRFVQSAGPFTLQPGAVNDITVGMVWARASGGGAFESVKSVQEADDKAQKLFDNCFVMIDGPDSPELKITELDGELIFQIYNLEGQSNNYAESPEDYEANDPFIVCPLEDGLPTDCDTKFKFQGYQVFQIKDKSVTTSDLDNPDYSRLVFQCDLKDDIDRIINYVNEPITGKLQPQLMVDGSNEGIVHTFKLTEDAFAIADKGLVNHKKYYYIAVAYAYNQFKYYDPDDAAQGGQKLPYLRGRKSASGSIKTFVGMPHINKIQDGGIILNSEYGDGIEVSMIEGLGNGNNILNLKQETIDEIMSGAPWRTDDRKYEKGNGPISIKVVDPLNVKNDNYILRFDSVVYHAVQPNLRENGYIDTADWYIYSQELDSIEIDTTMYVMINATQAIEVSGGFYGTDFYRGIEDVLYSYETLTLADNDANLKPDTFDVVAPVFNGFRRYPSGAILSEKSIDIENEQIISELGISITIQQVKVPGPGPKPGVYANENENNGFLTSEITFADPTQAWLGNVRDMDGSSVFNWIRSGIVDVDDEYFNSHMAGQYDFIDPDNKWSDIAGGLFSIYRLAAYDQNQYAQTTTNYGQVLRYQVAYDDGGNFVSPQGKDFDKYKRTPSIDIVITKDTNLWSRCPVVEMCEYDTVQTKNSEGALTGVNFIPGPSEGQANKFSLRKRPSVYRSGKPMPISETETFVVHNQTFQADSGMGWFPGYAIDVESGERLNIFFGEDSRWGSYNGKDMIWNPHEKQATDLYNATGGAAGELVFGAKHNIYVWGHSFADTTNIAFTSSKIKEATTAYDNGERLFAYLTLADTNKLPDGSNFTKQTNVKTAVYNNVVYVARPMLNFGFTDYDKEADPYGFIQSDVSIKIRMANPYRGLGPINTNGTRKNKSALLKPDSLALNNNAPMFTFSTEGLGATQNNMDVAESALDNINVVPNPYYAYNAYEQKKTQKLVKFTNLPENCVITIYNIGGNLVRRFDKSSPLTYLDWDLKNEYGIEIAGGVYIVHINVPGVGEKVLKWFGALRPIDLNNI